MPGQGTGIRENTIVSNNTIVCNMTISLNQTVFSHRGAVPVFGSSVNGHAFPYGGIVSNFRGRSFPFNLQVLRFARNYGTWKTPASLPDQRTVHDGHVLTYPGTF